MKKRESKVDSIVNTEKVILYSKGERNETRSTKKGMFHFILGIQLLSQKNVVLDMFQTERENDEVLVRVCLLTFGLVNRLTNLFYIGWESPKQHWI